MAISDVLSDACEEILGWMKAQPQAYAPWKADLERLVSDMDRIRVELDTPPSKINR